MNKLFILTFLLLGHSCSRNTEKEFIANLDVSFEGYVSSLSEISRGHGVVCLELTNQNYESYSEKLDGYFIFEVWKGGAKWVSSLTHLRVKDYIVFNKKGEKEILIFRNDTLHKRKRLLFPSNGWDYLNSKSLEYTCGTNTLN